MEIFPKECLHVYLYQSAQEPHFIRAIDANSQPSDSLPHHLSWVYIGEGYGCGWSYASIDAMQQYHSANIEKI